MPTAGSGGPLRPSSCSAPGTEPTYLTCRDEVAGPTLKARQMLGEAGGGRRLPPRFRKGMPTEPDREQPPGDFERLRAETGS